MKAHQEDLRVEVSRALRRDGVDRADADHRAAALAADVATRGSAAAPDDRLTALLAYAERLTKEPQAMGEPDVDALRAAGLDDAAVSSAAQVASYFNYINRIADGLGVDLEPEMTPTAGSTGHEDAPSGDPTARGAGS